jgi:type I restriction enzyme M protein
MLVGIDNDPRLVRVAKAYMIIENDGRSNIHQADSLDRRSWDNDLKKKLEDVSLILTNPPFAGAIKTATTLSQYDLTYKGDAKKKKPAKEVVRAILFLERCLTVLAPGGRMAIVLPQGLMNNINDAYVREYIDRSAQILAVIGLHEYTFLPFTRTKTSVLFLRKWNIDEAPVEDYEVFFDVSRRPGKNSYGQPVWADDGLLDTDVHEIAEAFVEWSRKQGFAWAA